MAGNLARNGAPANDDPELDVLRISGWCRVCRGDQCRLAVNHDALRVQGGSLTGVHHQGPWGIDQQQLRRIVPECQQDGMSGSRLSIPKGNPGQYPAMLRCLGEEAEAVAEVAGNEFVGQNMRSGDVRRHD